MKHVLTMHLNFFFPAGNCFSVCPRNAVPACPGLLSWPGSVAKFKQENEVRAQGTPATQSILDLVQTIQTAAKRAESLCSPGARLFICDGGNRSAIQ